MDETQKAVLSSISIEDLEKYIKEKKLDWRDAFFEKHRNREAFMKLGDKRFYILGDVPYGHPNLWKKMFELGLCLWHKEEEEPGDIYSTKGVYFGITGGKNYTYKEMKEHLKDIKE